MKKLLVIALLTFSTIAWAKPVTFFFQNIPTPVVQLRDSIPKYGVNFNGAYDPNTNIIYMNSKLSKAEWDTTYLHEYTHYVIDIQCIDLGTYNKEYICYMVEAMNILLDDRSKFGVQYGLFCFYQTDINVYIDIFNSLFP